MNKTKKMNVADIYGKFGIFIILIGTIIISAIISPAFLSVNNLTNVIRQNVTIGIVACGAQLVLLCGDVDLSAGSVAAFAGCLAAMVQVAVGNPVIALLTGIIIGGLIGFFNGAVITGCNIPSFIMTLATQQAARGAILTITKAKPISNLEGFTWFGQGYIGPVPVPILIWIIVLLITGFILNKMRFGRYIYAVGGNKVAAQASGIKVKRIITKCFTFAGLMSGLGGVVLMARVNSGQPNGGEQLEFDAITAVIIGGTSMSGGVGNIYGTIAGALFVGFLINIMTLLNVSAYFQQIVKGAIIALAVIIDVKVRNKSSK
ncbi:ABC transporter permease [Ruminococcus gauvreauii]|uniref:ABC transporter permease n=1 Tax=Ruminococcus gauvreauii TaxID=438033 RepID=UPI003983FB0D